MDEMQFEFQSGEQDLSHEILAPQESEGVQTEVFSEEMAAKALKTAYSLIAYMRKKDLWLMDDAEAAAQATQVVALARKYEFWAFALKAIEDKGPEFIVGYSFFGRVLADFNDERRKARERADAEIE